MKVNFPLIYFLVNIIFYLFYFELSLYLHVIYLYVTVTLPKFIIQKDLIFLICHVDNRCEIYLIDFHITKTEHNLVVKTFPFQLKGWGFETL